MEYVSSAVSRNVKSRAGLSLIYKKEVKVMKFASLLAVLMFATVVRAGAQDDADTAKAEMMVADAACCDAWDALNAYQPDIESLISDYEAAGGSIFQATQWEEDLDSYISDEGSNGKLGDAAASAAGSKRTLAGEHYTSGVAELPDYLASVPWFRAAEDAYQEARDKYNEAALSYDRASCDCENLKQTIQTAIDEAEGSE